VRPILVASFAALGCTGPQRTAESRAAETASGYPSVSGSEDFSVDAARQADGEPCERGVDCASGICEGPGCASYQGRCVSATRRCLRDLHVYCGCDGRTFTAPTNCPGKRYLTDSQPECPHRVTWPEIVE
jgi:hypothetical protein